MVRITVKSMTDAKLEDLVEHSDGVAFEENYGNEVVTALVVAGGVLTTARLIMRVVNEVRGGTVIDASVTPMTIDRNPALPYGFFVLRSSDGTVSVDGKGEPEDAIERMIGAVLSLGLNATSETAAAAVQTSLSADATVTIGA